MTSKTEKSIKIIAAVSDNGIIGLENNELPWVLPGDLAHFKKITTNNTIVMGWKTWQSIGERPLPNRMNIVLSRRKRVLPRASNIRQIHSAMDIYSLPKNWAVKGDLFIIGGGQIYSTYIMAASEMYITHVHMDIPNCEKCVKFPKIIEENWKEVETDDMDVHVENNIPYEFRHYVRA